jgi:hypothetical protein
VASAAALVLREAPGLSPTQVRLLLCETATDVSVSPAAPGRDPYTGCGVVNARAALERARSIPPYPVLTAPALEATVTAGEPVALTLTVSAYPDAVLTVDPSTPLPAGLTLAGGGSTWTLAGAPTTAGTHAITVVADSAGRAVAATLTVTVLPGPPAAFTLALPVAMRNSARFTPQLAAVDAYGNPTAPSAEPVVFTYSVAPECRFKRRAAPSFRSCVVTASTSAGVLAQGVIDVYDTTQFTRPSVVGTPKAGRKLKATVPKGWKRVTFQWFKNGKAVKGATGRVYTIPRTATVKAVYRVKVTIPGVSTRASEPVRVRKK